MKDCCIAHSDELLSIGQALQRIRQTVVAVTDHERVPLPKALGRILAEAVKSPINIPPQRVSAMDGYAFASNDITPNRPFKLQNIGASLAGKPFMGDLLPGQCIRIFTGAVVPNNADSVIMQESVSIEDNGIIFPSQTQGLLNIRQTGSDIGKNSLLLPEGKLMTACDCALLASAGLHSVRVKRKINIAFLATGNELTPIGTPLRNGRIYDSNRYALAGLLDNKCFNVSDLGVLGDNRHQLQELLMESASHHDAIITTGGASVGDADYIQEILQQYGQVDFWKIAIKPGKPLIFGRMGKCLFFGLPGNPVSAVVTFQKIVSPALWQLSGADSRKPLRIKAKCMANLRKAPGRQEYQRGILSQTADDQFLVDIAGPQDSHQLSALSKANCYIVLPAECDGVEAGESVTVEPFSIML